MLYPPRASVLGFVALGTARDVVRGFCATFATKSGKENGRLQSPETKQGRCQPPAFWQSWQDDEVLGIKKDTHKRGEEK